MKYGGVLAGYATIEVRNPKKFNGLWHRVYHAAARTGDWYKAIFVMHDKIVSFGRPWDFGVSKFYMKQDEGRILGSRFRQEKWMEFNHDTCKTKERVQQKGKDEKQGEFSFVRGANDVLGAYFNLRSRQLRQGVTEFLPVYTSEKSWLLEGKPVGVETVEVPAGKFKATKIKLKTYIGKELQQKGDVHIWIGVEEPRPMVQVHAEIKVGSIWIELKSFKKGS